MGRRVVVKQANSRMCFICGLKNAMGLKASFYKLEGGELAAVFTPREEHQGYPGRLHGGIAAPYLVHYGTEAQKRHWLPRMASGEVIAAIGMTEPGLDRMIRAAYTLLGLETYFTAGEKEVRAWTIHKGSTAPQAAGVIHTDFEKGYIRAQTIAFDDFIHYKGEQGAKDAGKMRAEGKDYVVKDGDVMNFLFSS